MMLPDSDAEQKQNAFANFLCSVRSDVSFICPRIFRKGPMVRFVIHSGLFIALTVLSQVGGLAWLVAVNFKNRLLVFVGTYALLCVLSSFAAPVFGRIPLACGDDSPLVVRSWATCALNRHYVTPDLHAALTDLATALAEAHPGTVTLVLDANFPFWNGFPLLPHLSHDDGRKADIALFYRDGGTGYLAGQTRSPIGYFAFQQGPTPCRNRMLDLRWDLDWLQPVWPDWDIDADRTRFALQWLAQDDRIKKVFIEPHLTRRLGLSDPKLRFQGCNAARHDDHIHLQL